MQNVPRPDDNAQECVRRILQGHTHAVVDLVDALGREDDPRHLVLAALLTSGMDRLREWPDPTTLSSATVAVFQQLAVNAVRVMNDEEIARRAQAGKTLVRRRGEPWRTAP